MLRLEDLDAINSFLRNEGIQPMPHENASYNPKGYNVGDNLIPTTKSLSTTNIRLQIINSLKKDKETLKKIEEYYSMDFDFLDYDKLSDICS